MLLFKGFIIEEILADVGVKFLIPAYKQNSQVTKELNDVNPLHHSSLHFGLRQLSTM